MTFPSLFDIYILCWFVQSSGSSDTTSITPLLDTFFVLARTSLVTMDQETYVPAYKYLARATALVLGDENNSARAVAGNEMAIVSDPRACGLCPLRLGGAS